MTDLKENEQELIRIAGHVLAFLNVRVSKRSLRNVIESHPNFPSLKTLVEVLPLWGIKVRVIPKEADRISIDQCPCMAELKDRGLVLIERVDESTVTVSAPGRTSEVITMESFSEQWIGDGELLHVKALVTAGEKDYAVKHRSEIFTALMDRMIIPLLVVFGFLFYVDGMGRPETPSILSILLLLKFAGALLCGFMIYIRHLDSSGADKFCSSGKTLDCLKVMKSRGGIFFGIPMTNLGLLYFGGGFFSIMLTVYMGYHRETVFLLSVLNLFTLPYTVFSLLYQATVVRKWCMMCVAVQVMFWFEFNITFKFLMKGWPGFTVLEVLPFAAGFGIPLLLWKWILNGHIKTKAVEKLQIESLRYHQNKEWIQMVIDHAPLLTPIDSECNIPIGTLDSPIQITLIVNPSCRSCRDRFRQLLTLMDESNTKIKGTIQFIIPAHSLHHPNEETTTSDQLAIYLSALALKGDMIQAAMILKQWLASDIDMDSQALSKWKKTFSSISLQNIQTTKEKLSALNEWIEQSKIKEIPILLLNNRYLPHDFNPEYLRYFLIDYASGSQKLTASGGQKPF